MGIIKVIFKQPGNIVQSCQEEPAKYIMIDKKFILSPNWQAWEMSKSQLIVAINYYEPVGNNKVRVIVGGKTKLCDIGAPLDAELIDQDKCIIL